LTEPTDVVSSIIGCNMAVRRELLMGVGDFDPLLSPGSGKDAGSEDADFVYRAFRKGIGIEYDPDVLVLHNHGRRSTTQVQNINRSYVRGRGSFYAKHILKGDIVALKMAYWELSPIFGKVLKGLLTGKSVRDDCKRVWFLCSGAMSRFTG
jgi:GT2 family glycosyltransferase